MASVAVAGVCKVYPGRVTAVTDLCLDVRDGELLALVGPSGCGKTTALRIIAGLERPTRGNVWIGGRDVTGVVSRDRDIAMVFQQHVLYPHLNVYRNMAFGLALRSGLGGPLSWLCDMLPTAAARRRRQLRREVSERVCQAAGTLGIGDLLNRRSHELSGGERQRVALGRALVRRPAVFLFDEPLSNLDLARRTQLTWELRERQRRSPTTTILVTHDQAEALSLGDRVAVMADGAIQQIGSPQSVYDRPGNRFVAGFIGTPPMNFWEGELSEQEGELAFVAGGQRVVLHASIRQRLLPFGVRHVALGVRPSDVVLRGFTAETSGRRFPARVLRIEPLGDSDVTHVELTGGADSAVMPGLRLTAGTERDADLRIGQRVTVEFSSRRIQLFDAATGANLTRDADCESAIQSR